MRTYAGLEAGIISSQSTDDERINVVTTNEHLSSPWTEYW